MNQLIEKLCRTHSLSKNEWTTLIENRECVDKNILYNAADKIRQRYYGKTVYLRGLIEFSNYCKNDCLYCGIRKSNINLKRYRLTEEEIIDSVKTGYQLGFRTFVLQSGEDRFYTPEKIASIVRHIKSLYPETAVTLSLGEYPEEVYRLWYESGADRYLLRHETANSEHYSKLHPKEMSLETRITALEHLRKIGYQVGAGFMVGSPYQTAETLAEDMLFLKQFQPHMVGIGPFIPHKDTPFRDFKPGTLEDTLFFLSLIRLTLPKTLLPATTALGTIHPLGREMGIRAGANVVMPNLTPTGLREFYQLYDNKICLSDEPNQCITCLNNRISNTGFKTIISRGDSLVT